MPNGFGAWGFLPLKGGTMEGDIDLNGSSLRNPLEIDAFSMNGNLNLKDNLLQFDDGTRSASLKVSPTDTNFLQPSTFDGSSLGNLDLGHLYVGTRIIVEPSAYILNEGLARTKLYRGSNQSIVNSSDIDIVWDTVDFNNKFSSSPVTSIVIPETGQYNIFVQASFYSNATGLRRLKLLDGLTEIARYNQVGDGGNITTLQCCVLAHSLIINDTIKAQVHQTSGASLNLYPGSVFSSIYIERVG